MVFSAIAQVPLPILLTTGAVGVLLSGAWLLRRPFLALWLIGISLVAGQLLRLPLPSQGGGLLLSDFAAASILGAAVVRGRYRLPSRQVRIILLSSLPFLTWAIGALVLNPLDLTIRELAIAASYWARLAVYVLLVPALLVLIEHHPPYYRVLEYSFYAAIVGLVTLGYVQLWVVPELATLGGGWDPHRYRFVSTWLDPNFLGMFLVITLLWLSRPGGARKHRNLPHLVLIIAAVGGLLLTQSRSSLMAAAVASMVVVPWLITSYLPRLKAAQKLMVSSTVVIALIISAGIGGVLLKERLTGLLSGTDPTVAIRYVALQHVWGLVQEHGWLGVGYNAYQFAALRQGLIGDFTIHSRAGSDNSWLTVWVTTGIAGLLLFIGLWLTIAGQLIARWRQDHRPTAAATLIALLAMVAHSQFVNSMLYAHLLVTLAIVVALALASPHPQQTSS